MMYAQDKKKNPRNTAMMLDVLHIAVGILVVICAVLAFVNPSGNQFLFPVIFWLAALLNCVNGWCRMKSGGRDRKKRAGAISLLAAAVLLFVIGALSAVGIWR
ncbi:MAG: hypothetical protein Q4C73_00415 [Eubacteriales bacterium]|nr:hypothetical protein [Eubacteriales bacterium]